jgi:mannose-6-phosphate isomerase-like protein (cupin superfamily)
MKKKSLRFGKGFRVVLGNRHAQAAEMVIAPGGHEGSAENRHRGSDQWLFVVSGKGVAVINGKRCTLRKNTLLLIRRGDRHEIRNSGIAMLRTLNLYVPPAYTLAGTPLPRGKGG